MFIRTCQSVISKRVRNLHTTKHLSLFYEPDRREGLPEKFFKKPVKQQNFFKQSLFTLKILKEEFKKLIDEFISILKHNPMLILPPEEVDVLFRFNKDQACLEKWTTVADSDWDQGYSTAKLELSTQGTGVFSGYLDTNVPKDGISDTTGYVNLRLLPVSGPFWTEKPFNWYPYTHLVLRVRGDGRTYNVNLTTHKKYDIEFFDLHSYLLYTRGGPYWQYTRIPFSKFFFVSKGTIQDQQRAMQKGRINEINFTLADKVQGPFRLEIDFIGVEYDEHPEEHHAYEHYLSKRIYV